MLPSRVQPRRHDGLWDRRLGGRDAEASGCREPSPSSLRGSSSVNAGLAWLASSRASITSARRRWYRGSGGQLYRNWCRVPIAAGAVLGQASTHGHEAKTERATTSDRRGAGPAPAAAAPRDPRGARRRRSRPCRCRCIGRSRLGTGLGGRSARRSAVPRLDKRRLTPGRYRERPKRHRPLPAQTSAAAATPRDDSYPLALAHWHARRSPTA